MTFKEIHAQELLNYDRIHFRKEGLFWKAYDHSAFLLHLLGIDYQLSWIGSKELPEGLVKVGTSIHPKELLPTKKVLVEEDKYVVLEAGITFIEPHYYEWRGKAVEGASSLVKTPKRSRRTIKVDPAMEAALREESPGEAPATFPGTGSQQSRSGEEYPSSWSDSLIDRLRQFDATGSQMQAFVMLVFSLKEEIAKHDREEEEARP